MTTKAKATRTPHGRRSRASGGYWAYVPDPLPPPIAWDAKLAAALSRADLAIGRLAGEGRKRLATAPSRLPERVLELFVGNPFWTVNKLAKQLEVAFTTAQRAIDRLETAGIVALAGAGKRNRVYCARAILDILEEPPRLAGTQRRPA